MKKTVVPFTQVPQLAKTDVAYVTGDPQLRPFYSHFPEMGALDALIAERSQRQYPRAELVRELQQQYAELPAKRAVERQVESLGLANTYTVVTAHQPSLFLGPLYFLYKALSAIHLAQSMQQRIGTAALIVPVFVLGSEDHDLEELNHATLFGKRLNWNPGLSGPVGSMSAASTASVLSELEPILGSSPAGQALFRRVQEAYQGERDFATATQALLHEFLGDLGLVVLNMNTPALKRYFIPVMRRELLEQVSFREVGNTIEQLAALGFKTQAAPREINLFYMRDGYRERIVREAEEFSIINRDLRFSETAMLDELEAHPERFSPNVVLRPVYQEMILPNLAYIGGGGELAYWLERKAQFSTLEAPFPMLVRRHSFLWLDKDSTKKLQRFGFHAPELFGETDALIRQYVEKNASGETRLEAEIADLRSIYDRLTAKAGQIDPTLEKSVRADETKALAGLEQWESRLLRAEKQKHEVALNQLRAWKEKLFPAGGLQERSENFLPYVLKYGEAFFQHLLGAMEPFEQGFVVLEDPEDQ